MGSTIEIEVMWDAVPELVSKGRRVSSATCACSSRYCESCCKFSSAVFKIPGTEAACKGWHGIYKSSTIKPKVLCPTKGNMVLSRLLTQTDNLQKKLLFPWSVIARCPAPLHLVIQLQGKRNFEREHCRIHRGLPALGLQRQRPQTTEQNIRGAIRLWNHSNAMNLQRDALSVDLFVSQSEKAV